MHAGPVVLPGVRSHSLEHGACSMLAEADPRSAIVKGRGVLRLQDLIMDTVVDNTRP